MAIASNGTAEPIAYVKSWALNAKTGKSDATAFGDPHQIFTAGLPSQDGSFAFWYDDATAQTYTAAVDGVARKAYFYPDFVNTPTQYWFGTVLPDFSINVTVSDTIDGSCDWSPASQMQKAG